jgi:hypothetical protein
MNSFDSPSGLARNAEYLRERIARLRGEIARLRLGPANESERRAIRAWRFAAAVLWVLGAVSLLVLAAALFTFVRVGMGGLKG